MSGTGQQDFRAPVRLTPISGDQPIAEDRKGGQYWPTNYFFQMIQRILAYLGQPDQGSRGGQTISQQLGSLASITDLTEFAPGADSAGLDSRIARLEQLRSMQAIAAPARAGVPQRLPPLFELSASQIEAMIDFGM